MYRASKKRLLVTEIVVLKVIFLRRSVYIYQIREKAETTNSTITIVINDLPNSFREGCKKTTESVSMLIP